MALAIVGLLHFLVNLRINLSISTPKILLEYRLELHGIYTPLGENFTELYTYLLFECFFLCMLHFKNF